MEGGGLEALLTALVSGESAKRSAAETKWGELHEHGGMLEQLSDVAHRGQGGAEAQLSAVLLRREVDARWAGVSRAEKAPVRVRLLQLLSGERAVRFQAAAALVTVLSRDYPAEWPAGVRDLLGAGVSGGSFAAEAALRILAVLVEGGTLDDGPWLQVFHDVEPVLAQAAAVSPPNEVTAAAFRCLKSLVEAMPRHSASTGRSFRQAFQQAMASERWEEPLRRVWQGEFEGPAGSWAAAMAAAGFVHACALHLPALLGELARPLLVPAWAALFALATRYAQNPGDAQSEDVELDSWDGEPVGFAPALERLLHIPSVLVERKAFRAMVAANAESLAQLACALLSMTRQDEERWLHEPSEQLAREDDEDSGTVRGSAGLLLVQLHERGGANAQSVEGTLRQLIATSASEPAAWRTLEAALYGAGRLLLAAGAGESEARLARSLNVLRAVRAGLSYSGISAPLVCARAFWVCSLLPDSCWQQAPVAPPSSAEESRLLLDSASLLEKSLQSLMAPESPLMLRLSAARVVGQLLPRQPSSGGPHSLAQQAQHALLTLLSAEWVDGDAAVLLLEAWALAVVSSPVQGGASPLPEHTAAVLVAVWRRCASDPHILGAVVDGVHALLSRVPPGAESAWAHAVACAFVPGVLSLLCGQASKDCDAGTRALALGAGLAVLSSLLLRMHEDDPSFHAMVSALGPPLVREVCLDSADDSVVQQGSRVLAGMLLRLGWAPFRSAGVDASLLSLIHSSSSSSSSTPFPKKNTEDFLPASSRFVFRGTVVLAVGFAADSRPEEREEALAGALRGLILPEGQEVAPGLLVALARWLLHESLGPELLQRLAVQPVSVPAALFVPKAERSRLPAGASADTSALHVLLACWVRLQKTMLDAVERYVSLLALARLVADSHALSTVESFPLVVRGKRMPLRPGLMATLLTELRLILQRDEMREQRRAKRAQLVASAASDMAAQGIHSLEDNDDVDDDDDDDVDVVDDADDGGDHFASYLQSLMGGLEEDLEDEDDERAQSEVLRRDDLALLALSPATPVGDLSASISHLFKSHLSDPSFVSFLHSLPPLLDPSSVTFLSTLLQ